MQATPQHCTRHRLPFHCALPGNCQACMQHRDAEDETNVKHFMPALAQQMTVKQWFDIPTGSNVTAKPFETTNVGDPSPPSLPPLSPNDCETSNRGITIVKLRSTHRWPTTNLNITDSELCLAITRWPRLINDLQQGMCGWS